MMWALILAMALCVSTAIKEILTYIGETAAVSLIGIDFGRERLANHPRYQFSSAVARGHLIVCNTPDETRQNKKGAIQIWNALF